MQESLFYINKTLITKKPEQNILETYLDVTLQDQKVKVSGLNMKVTSHRILLDGNFDHSFLIEGDKIKQALISESGFLWGKQYLLKLRTQYGKVKFHMKNYKQAQITINGMIKNKAWTQKMMPSDHGPKMYSGLFNKIEKQKQKIDENAVKVGESFTSFQSLFGNLRQIKQVMKEMRTNTGQVDSESSQVHQILKDIGFVSVISKQQVGRDFSKHLAKDLYSICINTLFKKYGGMVSLLDLFYFYNMKRQMQLISPEQLYQACLLFQKLGMNAKLITYPNNIKVIESTSFDKNKDFEEHFKQYFHSYERGYSAQEIARKKGLPLTIIEIKLDQAVQRGILAIDSRIEGIKYYKNMLLQI